MVFSVKISSLNASPAGIVDASALLVGVSFFTVLQRYLGFSKI